MCDDQGQRNPETSTIDPLKMSIIDVTLYIYMFCFCQAYLKKANVKVFQMNSKNENMILQILGSDEDRVRQRASHLHHLISVVSLSLHLIAGNFTS